MRINEIDQTSKILDNINQISYNDPSGWYVSGCYEFALALNKALPGSTIITADDAEGTDMHAFVKSNGKYYDINGEHLSPDDVIQDGDFSYNPPLSYHKTTFNSLSQNTMQVDMSNVNELAQELTQ